MAPKLRPGLIELRGYHSPQVDVAVRLNTNESPYPPPPEFVEALAGAIRDVPFNRYPDRAATALRIAIGAYAGVDAAAVLAANGSNEVLETLLVAFGGPSRKALMFTPSYTMHRHIADMTGTPVVGVPRGDDYTISASAVIGALDRHRPDVVFFCHPNNPTGALERMDAIEAAIGWSGELLVIVDEAYGEMAAKSALPLVREYGNVVVVRTMSKAWSVSALRLGYVVGPPELVADLGPAHLPYHLGAISQLAGCLALGYVPEMRARVAALIEGREHLRHELESIGGVHVWPSEANFLLFRPQVDGHLVWGRLLERGVLVRDFAGRPETPNCLRVTVGTPEENTLFVEALRESLAAG